MRKLTLFGLHLFLLLPSCLCAQSVLTLDPAVRKGKLTNGFTYYIRHNEEPKNRVLLYLVNKAGSVLEDEDQRGLAHFMEHMSFNGTKHFPHNQLVDYLQKAGIRFGADLNAYTSFDETVYQLPIPSDKPELLKGGMEIMRDWAHEATLDPTEIDKERGVVLEEKRLAKGASERMRRIYWPMLLNHSRYAVRIPIGLDTVLNNFQRPGIARFYKDWYRPDLQALIIVGDVDVDAIEQTIKAKFGDLRNPAHEKARVIDTVPLTGKNQFLAVTDKEMVSTQVEVIIKHPEPKLKTTADYRAAIMRNLFDQMLTERYAEIGRKADPPFIQGGAGISGFIGGLDSYSAEMTAKPGELEKGFKALWRESERVRRFGFTQTELDRAKQNYLSNMASAYKEKDKTQSESYVKEYQQNFLKDIAAPGITKEYELVLQDLPGITLSEVNNLDKQYITAINRDILVLAPDKDKAALPGEAAISQWIKTIEQEQLEPYRDEVSSQPFLTKEIVPGKIIKEQSDTALHVTNLALSNGVKVILKPTDFKNDQVLFSAFAPGGTSVYPDADYQSAANAAAIISSSGAGNYNSTQLDKYLSGKQLGVSPYISERTQGISGGSTYKDLETALQLVYAYFTEPRKDTAIFQGIIARSKAELMNRSADPNNVFQDTVSAILSNYNERRTGPSIAKVDQINLDKSYQIYKERFADAANFTFTFVGSFEVKTLKPLLEKYLGALPAINSHEQAKDLAIHISEGKIQKTVYKGSEPKARVDLVFSGTFDYSQENKLKLDALKEVLQIRLVERLREDESGVYSPGVFVNTGKFPQSRFSFVISFGCAPQNVEKLVASALDEIDKLKSEGPPQVNVDKYKAEDLRTRETALKTNKWWLGYLSSQLQNKEEIDQLNAYRKIQDQLTPASLKDAAGKYLSGKNYIRLNLLPETTMKSK